MKIQSIEVGWGEESIFYSVSEKANKAFRVDEIKATEQFIGKGLHNDLTLTIYQVIRGGNVIAEIEAGSGLHITFESSHTPTEGER